MEGEKKEYCGLFGIFGHPDAVHLTYMGLYALQHRGQESAGICSSDGRTLQHHRGMGLVGKVFTPEILEELKNPAAIGHVRYSTTGSSNVNNAQPLVVSYARGQVAIAHNGNLVNGASLRRDYEAHGSIFQTTSDSEVIAHIMAKPSHIEKDNPIQHCLNHIKGAYSLLIQTPKALVAARDPQGFRPLCMGELEGATVFASESCALDLVGARFVREIEPGEAVTVTSDGVTAMRFCESAEIAPAHCIFEHIYFSRPDSRIFGDTVHETRKKLGRLLAQRHPVDADVVISIPDSGNSAAVGFSEESGIPLDRGFIKNNYVGRTFIQPFQGQRDASVRIKLNVVQDVIRGKRVVVVDDSIVRGTTQKAISKILKAAGATERHLRITSPPHVSPCYYGIDFPTADELIAANNSVEEIRRHLNVDSLGYLTVEDLHASVSRPGNHYCSACFDGNYPVPIDGKLDKYVMERY